MADIEINAEKFFQRLERLIDNWTTHKMTSWGGCDAICIPSGPSKDEGAYSKSSALHLHLFGLEFPDSIIVISKSNFWFMATEKKCRYIEALASQSTTISINILKRTKDEGSNKENMHTLIDAIRKSGTRLGSLFKSEYDGNFIPGWMNMITDSHLDKVEIGTSIGLLLAVKDATEIDLCRRAAVLSNKVMKHGFVAKMEAALDNEETVLHDKLAEEIEGIIYDPMKIEIKVTADVDCCFTPIIQSGGKYDIKPSAESNKEAMSSDVIICSLGARYKGYCANVSRTFMVDAPKKIEQTYALLVAVYSACLDKMIPGNELKEVMIAAKTLLASKDPSMLAYLPKTLGFVIGLEFRDGTLVLNERCSSRFSESMTVTLSVGFHNVPLTAEDKKGAAPSIQKLEQFSLLVADTVLIKNDFPEIMTKIGKDFGDVSYNMQADEDGKGGEEDDAEDQEVDENGVPVRRSSRFSAEERAETEQRTLIREQKQAELRQKKMEDARRKIESRRRSGGAARGSGDDDEFFQDAQDLRTYPSTEAYPRDVLPNRLKIDKEREALIVPVHGRPVPFHMSAIKNLTRPEEGKTTYMRINFHVPTAGNSVSKEMAKNMQQLVLKYGDSSVFVKEMTFRSHDPRNLLQVYQDFTELRKKMKAREVKADQEKDLVVQAKLIKIKDQRIPRLQDVTMRPGFTGRKCQGVLEAHQNGLRFTSTKAETVDIMYQNVKHAIYQPCEKTTLVLVHFHLKDFMMIGRKKLKDVQFITEVIESSINMEGARRFAYDPDELDEEQREREMKKRLNLAFKDFCQKLEKVTEHYGFRMKIEVPFRKSGFEGNCFREMVFIMPTLSCVVNLTETPSFLVSLSEVDHVHLERVTYGNKNFDLTFIFKNLDLTPRTITAVDMRYKEGIEDWLTISNISYTEGKMNIKWDDVIKKVTKEYGDYFYLDTDQDGEKKPPGWLFLDVRYDSEGSEGEDEEDEDDSSFSKAEAASDEESDEDSEDDEDSDEYVDSDDDEDEEDEDDEDDEGDTWEELEKKAALDDKKRVRDDDDDDKPRKKGSSGGGGGGGGGGGSSSQRGPPPRGSSSSKGAPPSRGPPPRGQPSRGPPSRGPPSRR